MLGESYAKELRGNSTCR